ncbi:uncharacterized protein CMC5_006650 [Chondromyces crocatus]|uniref:Uncharacterized protein n=1 Tax=Chondromyces crocatus TaxID=52 RepID=A0A0K1E783_CHOCO|nr:uncharacterized protein CMC5_006650 [Chondromyces crocatus]
MVQHEASKRSALTLPSGKRPDPATARQRRVFEVEARLNLGSLEALFDELEVDLSQRLGRLARVSAFLFLAGSAGWLGCGSDPTSTSSTTTAGNGGGGGEGGTGGGGAGGPPQSFGPPGTEVVSAAGVATSSSYRLIFTVGQSTQNQNQMTSNRFRLNGGVIGANEDHR